VRTKPVNANGPTECKNVVNETTKTVRTKEQRKMRENNTWRTSESEIEKRTNSTQNANRKHQV